MLAHIERVRASIARAATDPMLWPETLWRVSQLLGSDMALCERWSNTADMARIGLTDNPGLVAQLRDPYESHYCRVSPRFLLQQRLPRGALAHDALIGDEAVLDRDEFYADFLPRYDLRYFIGVELACGANHTTVLSLQRAPARGRYTERDLEIFSSLLPDIQHALSLWLQVGGNHGPMLPLALDRLAIPIAVVDGEGLLHFANRAMDALFAASDIVRVRNGKVAGMTAPVRKALAACLRHAGAPASSGLWATRAHDLILRAARLESETARCFAPGRRLFCLTIDAPRQERWGTVNELIRLYGLTRREAAVGLGLVDGLDVDAIAMRLAVSRNTVRSHLAMLREKLGMHSALAVAAELRRGIGAFM